MEFLLANYRTMRIPFSVQFRFWQFFFTWHMSRHQPKKTSEVWQGCALQNKWITYEKKTSTNILITTRNFRAHISLLKYTSWELPRTMYILKMILVPMCIVENESEQMCHLCPQLYTTPFLYITKKKMEFLLVKYRP